MTMARFVRFVCFSMLFLAGRVFAQTPVDQQIGLTPFQSYQPGAIDAVNLANGAVQVNIPLISYPQRGSALKLAFSLVDTGKHITSGQSCFNVGTVSDPYIKCGQLLELTYGAGTNGVGAQVVDAQSVILREAGSYYSTSGGTNSFQAVQSFVSSDGAQHAAAGVKNQALQIALDGSGYSWPNGYAINCDSNCALPPVSDASGVLYFQAEGSASGSIVREDSDGNEITGTPTDFVTAGTTPIVDTVGRNIPAMSSTSDFTGCSGPLPTTSALTWNLPGPSGGSLPYKFCYADVPISIPYADCGYGTGTFSDSATMLQSVVRPDNLTWTFAYSSAGPNDPSGTNYGELSQITYPTGGTLSYTYTLIPRPYRLSSGQPGALCTSWAASRTENANDGSGSHTTTYSWNQPTSLQGSLQNTVTDPLGNVSVHAFEGYCAPSSDETGACTQEVETETQVFQGTNTGTPLQDTVTTYGLIQNTNNGGIGDPGYISFAPTQRVTTLNGLVTSQETIGYCCAVTVEFLQSPSGSLSSSSGEQAPHYTTQTANYMLPNDDRAYDYGPSGPGGLLKETKTQYEFQSNAAYATAGMIAPIASTQILNGSGTQVGFTSYTYDEPSYLQPANISTQHGSAPFSALNHVTTTTQFVGASSPSLVSHTSWFDTGTVYQNISPLNHATTYAYGSQYGGALLTGITDAVGHITATAYDPGTGASTSTTDANNQTTSYVYDNVGRLWTVQNPDATGGVSSIYCYTSSTATEVLTAQGAPLPAQSGGSSTTCPTASGNTTEVISTSDGIGRLSSTETATAPGGPITTAYTYDPDDRLSTQSNPYQSTSDPTYGLTQYAYDALSRTTQVTNPDNTITSRQYSGATATLTDENGNQSQQRSDGLGRLASVIEPDAVSGAPSYETDNTYDALGNVVQIDQWGGAPGSSNTSTCLSPNGSAATGTSCDRQRVFTYDGLSRLLSSTNPEAGLISYVYDNDSNVHTRTDARGIVTTYSYDPAERLTGKTYTDATPAITYNYDTALQGWNFINQTSPVWTNVQQTNLVGRLSYESDGNAEILYGYDSLGRTVLKSECTPSTCGQDHYDLHASYDLAGNVAFADRGLDVGRNAASPNAGYYYGGLAMTYDTAGRMNQATADIVDSAHPQTILGTLNYNPLGEVYTVELGQQYGQASQYDPRGRITSRSSINLAGYTVLADQWTYDMVGNMKTANDSAQGKFSYDYDALNRVKDGMLPPASTAYGYDPWGNQTSHTAVEGSTYQWNYMPTTQNRSSAPGVGYDASGNMLSDGQHNYTYDAEGRITAVTDQGVSYLYDPEGLRVATSQGGAITNEYLYDLNSELVTTVNNNGMLVRSILRADETHWGDYIGQAGPGGVRTEFRLVNQVGTLVANGDSQGNYVEGCLSGPFGDGQDCNPSYDFTETHFTDKLRDEKSYNDYFGARYFNSTLGRFLSPDWSDAPEAVPYANPSNPQSLNLYSYTHNNPLTYIDEDGHEDAPANSGAAAAGSAGSSGIGFPYNCSGNIPCLLGRLFGFLGGGSGSGGSSADGGGGATGQGLGDMPLDPGAVAMVRGIGHNANTILPIINVGAIVAAAEVVGPIVGSEVLASQSPRLIIRAQQLNHAMRVEVGHTTPLGSPSEIKAAIQTALNARRYTVGTGGVVNGTAIIRGVAHEFTGFLKGNTLIFSNIYGGR